VKKGTTTEAPRTLVFKASATVKSKRNQYGRFKYNEKQYGQYDKGSGDGITVHKVPIRMRVKDGIYIYTQHVEIPGKFPNIRIRSKQGSANGEWTYLQLKEV